MFVDNLIQFIGRLHPLIVHLPIGILMLAIGLHFLTWRKRYTAYRGILPLIWLMGCISSVLACIAGYALSLNGEYATGAVDIHMWSGICLVIFSGAVYIMLKRNVAATHQITTVVVSGILLTTTGHWGGNLTHGEDYLTEPLFAMLGLESKFANEERPPITNIQEALVYQDLVVPILESRCYACHGATKQKGRLRLDTQEAILKGGEHGEVLTPGDADNSRLYTSLVLPEEHDDHMPPKGKPQLTENEIALIQWWVSHGKATFTAKVAEIERNEEMKAMLASFTTAGQSEASVESEQIPPEIPTVKVSKADPAALQRLKKLGVVFTPLTADHVFLAANLVNNPQFQDADLDELSAIRQQLVWLDLSGTSITDAGLKRIGSLNHLTRLSLDNTSVTDAGLEHLKQLPLQYLNLYGTKITDEGLRSLSELDHLRKLYIWKTPTTPQGIKRFEKATKGRVEIIGGNRKKN